METIKEWLDFYDKNLKGKEYIVKEIVPTSYKEVCRGYDHLGCLGFDRIPADYETVERQYTIFCGTAIEVARKLVDGKARLVEDI